MVTGILPKLLLKSKSKKYFPAGKPDVGVGVVFRGADFTTFAGAFGIAVIPLGLNIA
jgi:hypothetical protein